MMGIYLDVSGQKAREIAKEIMGRSFECDRVTIRSPNDDEKRQFSGTGLKVGDVITFHFESSTETPSGRPSIWRIE